MGIRDIKLYESSGMIIVLVIVLISLGVGILIGFMVWGGVFDDKNTTATTYEEPQYSANYEETGYLGEAPMGSGKSRPESSSDMTLRTKSRGPTGGGTRDRESEMLQRDQDLTMGI